MFSKQEGPAGERVLDVEGRLQRARDVAWRQLDRRDRTLAEMRRALAGNRVEPELGEQVIDELSQSGYLDDARYAQRFAEDRRRLDSWGSDRIERRLRALGVESDHIATAVAGQDPDGELTAALELLERRYPRQPETPQERDRALKMLVGKGYGLELAYDAVRRRAGATELD